MAALLSPWTARRHPLSQGRTGDFAYTYTATLAADERLDPVATDGTTCVGSGGALTPCVPPGTFFTIYDIAGFAGVGPVPADWNASVQFVGLTPSNICGTCIDNPILPNITFAYTGPVVSANGVDVAMDGFQIISTFDATSGGAFSSQATLDIGDSAGDTDQFAGSLSVPAAGISVLADTPEPRTFFLLGIGLVGVAMLRRPRR
jgi:hypothetical protein